MEGNFIVAICSRDGRAPISSIATITDAAMQLGRHFDLVISQGTGLAAVRNNALRQIKFKFPDAKRKWVFWLDDDIHIMEGAYRIVQLVEDAERWGLSWCANYNQIKDHASLELLPTVYKNGHDLYRYEELQGAADFELAVHHGGLGLAYIDTPLDYNFHTSGLLLEDNYFYDENFEFGQIRYCKVNNRHIKTVPV